MLKRHLRNWGFIFVLVLGTAPSWAKPPALVVILVGDQVRADYLERFHDELGSDGLRLFRNQGTYFTEAAMDHAVTKTSPGHTLIGSGLSPAQSGIVDNSWYDTTSGKMVSAVEIVPGGPRTKLRWFMGTSLAQRVHKAYPHSRVIGVSLKDRGALLLGGPDQDDAYWQDMHTKKWISYQNPSPGWLTTFNQTSSPFEEKSPVSDTMIEALAETAATNWNLGHNASGEPDVLTVSFSAVDLVGHEKGPDSPEVKATFLNLDHMVAKLVKDLNAQVGPSIVWVFSSDHGVTPIPELSQAKGLKAGRVRLTKDTLAHPEGVEAVSAPFIYLKDTSQLEAVRAEVKKMEGVAAVYSESEVRAGKAPSSILKTFYLPAPGASKRCGDLMVVLKPLYIFSEGSTGTTHGQPTPDDQRVPLAFYGVGIPTRVISRPVSPAVVTPTLMKLMDIPAPDLSAPAVSF